MRDADSKGLPASGSMFRRKNGKSVWGDGETVNIVKSENGSVWYHYSDSLGVFVMPAEAFARSFKEMGMLDKLAWLVEKAGLEMSFQPDRNYFNPEKISRYLKDLEGAVLMYSGLPPEGGAVKNARDMDQKELSSAVKKLEDEVCRHSLQSLDASMARYRRNRGQKQGD